MTFDSAYSDLRRHGAGHAGIAYFPNAPRDAGVLLEAILLLDGVFEPAEFENRLEYM